MVSLPYTNLHFTRNSTGVIVGKVGKVIKRKQATKVQEFNKEK